MDCNVNCIPIENVYALQAKKSNHGQQIPCLLKIMKDLVAIFFLFSVANKPII